MSTRRERFQSLLLAVVLAIGAGTAWAMFLVFSYGILVEIFPSLGYSGPSNPYHELVVTSDGTPLIESGEDRQHRVYSLFDGRTPFDLKDTPLLKPSFIMKPTPTDGGFEGIDWPQRIRPLYPGNNSETIWYFVHDGQLHGRGYFVGYDNHTKLVIGYAGRKGFCDTKPATEDQFPVNGRRLGPNDTFFQNGDRSATPRIQDAEAIRQGDKLATSTAFFPSEIGVVAIDFRDRTVQVVWEGADLGSVGFLREGATVGVQPLVEWTPRRLMVRTSDQVFELNFQGKLLRTFTLPKELRDRDLYWFDVSPTEALVREFWGGEDLFWINKNGDIVRKEHVALRRPSCPQSNTSWVEEQVGASSAVPCPGLIASICVAKPWLDNGVVPTSAKYFSGVGREFARVWLFMVVACAISIILAVLCYRRQRKFGLEWTWVWTGFVLVFGLPAYFGYLAHRQWPARLACPSCGRRVPRDRPACFACGQDFPAPAPKGIEVFA